jgi:hypothetical protein
LWIDDGQVRQQQWTAQTHFHLMLRRSQNSITSDFGAGSRGCWNGDVGRGGQGDWPAAPNEKYIIFSSHGRPDGHGDRDLYISFQKEGGTWTKPKNLGPAINTKAAEFVSALSPDGKYLFFDRHENAERDIYWVGTELIDEMGKSQ